MNYRIIPEPRFLREMKRLAKKYKSMKQDLQRLNDELLADPTCGVDLGEGFRKVRMAIASKNRGKRHGARVITYLYAVNEVEGNISLLSIYDKQEKDNISEAELRQLKAEIKAKLVIVLVLITKKTMKRKFYKKRRYAPKRTLADVLDENYISKKELMS